MAQMENDGIEYADAFFCCGDYDYNYTDSINGIKSLQETMSYYVEEEKAEAFKEALLQYFTRR